MADPKKKLSADDIYERRRKSPDVPSVYGKNPEEYNTLINHDRETLARYDEKKKQDAIPSGNDNQTLAQLAAAQVANPNNPWLNLTPDGGSPIQRTPAVPPPNQAEIAAMQQTANIKPIVNSGIEFPDTNPNRPMKISAGLANTAATPLTGNTNANSALTTNQQNLAAEMYGGPALQASIANQNKRNVPVPTPAQIAAATTLHELPVNLSQMSEDNQKHMLALAKGSNKSVEPPNATTIGAEPAWHAPMAQPEEWHPPMQTPEQQYGAKPAGSGAKGSSLEDSALGKFGKDWDAGQQQRITGSMETYNADRTAAAARAAGLETAANVGNNAALSDKLQGSLTDDARRSADENLKQKMIEIQKDTDKLADAKIDPKHFYKEQGTAMNIAGAIAIGLGAVGAGMPHTGNNTNVAANIISKAVDNDISAQKDNLDNKWKALASKKQIATDDFTHSQWNIEQMNVARVKAWYAAEQQIKSQMMQTDSDVAKTEGDKLLGVVHDRIGGLNQEMAKHRYDIAALQQNAAAAAAAKKAAAEQAQRTFLAARTAHYTDEGGMSPREAGQRALEDANVQFNGVLPTNPNPYVSRKATEKIMEENAKGSAVNEGLEKGIRQVQHGYDQFISGKSFGGNLVSPDGNPGVIRSAVNTVAGKINPGSDTNLAVQARDQFNNEMTNSLHQLMTVRGQPFIESMAAPFLITPWDNDATIAQKRQKYEEFMRPQANLAAGKKSVTSENIPGE
jgi:hypothetical protein